MRKINSSGAGKSSVIKLFAPSFSDNNQVFFHEAALTIIIDIARIFPIPGLVRSKVRSSIAHRTFISEMDERDRESHRASPKRAYRHTSSCTDLVISRRQYFNRGRQLTSARNCDGASRSPIYGQGRNFGIQLTVLSRQMSPF